MINKNPAAYFYFYFTTVAKMEEELVQKVVKLTIDPMVTSEVDQCKWDAKKLVLSTLQDEENKRNATLQNVAWYKDAFGEYAFDMIKKEKKKQMRAEELRIYTLIVW
jgi:hypothetical protein